MGKKVIVLLSGGLDSACVLAHAKQYQGNIIALNIFYGQNHSKEQECAKKIADYYNVPIEFMNLAEIYKHSDCSLIIGDIPKLSYKQQLKKNKIPETYVPFRNGLFLSIATSKVYSEDSQGEVYCGIHAGDDLLASYPDCSSKFIDSMKGSVYFGTGKKVTLETPFSIWDKAQIVKHGIALKVPFELTWSCYNNGDKPCGECATCIERAEAFKNNNAVDPAI